MGNLVLFGRFDG